MNDAAPSWINKGSNPYPDWLQPHVAGKREPNGSLMIRTARGKDKVQARVLVNNIVILHGAVAHTCPAGEAKDLLAELDRAGDIVSAELAQRAVSPAHNAKHVPTSVQELHKTRKAKAAPAARAHAYPAPLGSRPTIEWIHVERLSLDAEYQRSTENHASQRLIGSIAANFDWRLCTPLVVSRRADSKLVVLDGQHRTLAARKRPDLPDLPCCVFTFDSIEDEAKMFIAMNRSRKAMNRLDDFHAALAAGDSDAHQIRQLVTDAGLTVARNTASAAWKPGEIAFTASIAGMLRKHGAAIVSAALTNIAEAFPNQKVVHSGSIFLGLVKVLASPPGGFDPDRMFRALLKYSAEEWGSFVAGLKGGDTRATAIRDALLMAYEETPQEAAGETA